MTDRAIMAIQVAVACALLLPHRHAGAQTTPLTWGFETASELAQWERVTYGAEPRVRLDHAERHGGLASLRIAADAPSDTAIAHETRLAPGRWYRLTFWVRADSLDPGDSSVSGAVQVQLPGGRGLIASSSSTSGTTAWAAREVVFRSPHDGRVRLSLFFVGFGRGTGAVWFDDIMLEEIGLQSTPVRITNTPIVDAAISSLQYGQFVEYLCDLVPGMWADKLDDGSFEGMSPYGFVFLKETDDRRHPWTPCGAVNGAEFAPDAEVRMHGACSHRVRVADGPPCTVGVQQTGLAVRRGVACTLALYLRQAGLKGPVQAELRDSGRVLARSELRPGAEWTRHTARLVPAASSARATLAITFRGPGTLWLDCATLMPDDAVGGWRPDVVAALRALRPGIIRFGGSVVDYPSYGDYEWRKTIGPVEQRVPFRSWGGGQPVGAGLEEFVQLCRLVGAEPLICVRFHGSTPDEAAAQVEYFNGSQQTPMGAIRARNGHAEPYAVRYWQVGNEVKCDEYDAQLAGFCRAMRAADPTIKLMASYPTPELLRNAGEYLDYVCPHHYGCADLGSMRENIAEVRRMIAGNAPGRSIRLGITEWNTTAGDWGPPRAMLWTLANALACARYHNLMHRHADIIEIANRSNMTNSFCSGILQTDAQRLYKTPTYYAQMLYATKAGSVPLGVDSLAPPDVGLDISATRSEDGRKLTVFVVNDGPTDETRTLDVGAAGRFHGPPVVTVLADRDRAGEPDVTNTFDRPDRVVATQVKSGVWSAGGQCTFAPYSLTVLEWRATP